MDASMKPMISVKLSTLELFYQYTTDVENVITVQNGCFVLALSRA